MISKMQNIANGKGQDWPKFLLEIFEEWEKMKLNGSMATPPAVSSREYTPQPHRLGNRSSGFVDHRSGLYKSLAGKG